MLLWVSYFVNETLLLVRQFFRRLIFDSTSVLFFRCPLILMLVWDINWGLWHGAPALLERRGGGWSTVVSIYKTYVEQKQHAWDIMREPGTTTVEEPHLTGLDQIK